MKSSLVFAILALSILMSGSVGCKSEPSQAVKRSERTGVPVAEQSRMLEIMKNADKNEGLTDAEWIELEAFVASVDPKVRLEAVTALGGISKNKTTQSERINKFLTDRENDPDQKVRERAALIKKFHAPGPVTAPSK